LTSTSTSIVGVAGCTSLGYSLAATFAAMGSGLNNFSDTGLKTVFGTPVTAASLLDVDVPRQERLTALATVGLMDLQALMERLGVDRAPLMVGLPSDLDDRELSTVSEGLAASRLVASTPACFPYGRASAFGALAYAVELVERGTHRCMIVAGIDSLCALDTVQRLVQLQRVLGPHTEGTIPGEAAMFAIIAREEDPAADRATAVRLESIANHRAPPFTEMTRVSADGLATVFGAFRERGSARVDRVVAAHSGEGYFGRSFAQAYLREMDVMPEPLEVEIIADRVGDVGAAAGILGLAFAMHLMDAAAEEAPARALVYSESDTGELGAAIIESPSALVRRRAAASS